MWRKKNSTKPDHVYLSSNNIEVLLLLLLSIFLVIIPEERNFTIKVCWTLINWITQWNWTIQGSMDKDIIKNRGEEKNKKKVKWKRLTDMVILEDTQETFLPPHCVLIHTNRSIGKYTFIKIPSCFIFLSSYSYHLTSLFFSWWDKSFTYSFFCDCICLCMFISFLLPFSGSPYFHFHLILVQMRSKQTNRPTSQTWDMKRLLIQLIHITWSSWLLSVFRLVFTLDWSNAKWKYKPSSSIGVEKEKEK